MRTDIKLTYSEYQALPETGPRYQLVEGDLILSPAPTLRHQKILARLFKALIIFVDAKKLGTVLCAPLDVILSEETVLQPDLVFICNARKGIEAPEGLRGAPDLCIEVLSPTKRDLDLNVKRVLYARYGVQEFWIVDPDSNTIQKFDFQVESAKPEKVFSRSDQLTSLLLPGFVLNLGDVFAS